MSNSNSNSGAAASALVRGQMTATSVFGPVLRHLKAPPRPGAPAGLMVTCCGTKDRAERDACL